MRAFREVTYFVPLLLVKLVFTLFQMCDAVGMFRDKPFGLITFWLIFYYFILYVLLNF